MKWIFGIVLVSACGAPSDGGMTEDASDATRDVAPVMDAFLADTEPMGADATLGDAGEIDSSDPDAGDGDASGVDAEPNDAEPADASMAPDAWTPPTGPLDPTFQVADATAVGCVARTSTVSAREGLGFVASRTRILHNDNSWMGSFSLESLRGEQRPATTQLHILSDLATGKVYSFLLDPNPALGVRRLVELDARSGDVTGNQVVLSTNIPIGGGQFLGIYSGLGYAVIQAGTSGGRLYDIELATGDVTDIGPAPPIETSAPWATYPNYWGIREEFDGSVHLLRPQPPSSVVRYRISDGTTSTLRRLTWLSSMYSIAVVPRLGRWYFRHTGPSQFRYGDNLDTIGYCRARFTSPGVFEMIDTSPPIGSPIVTTPTIDGVAEPGATIHIFSEPTCAGPPIGLGTAGLNGTFSVAVPAALGAATTYFGNAVRPNGNVTLCVQGPTYHHDTMPPAFAGATQATAVGTSISIFWNAGFDDQTDVRYEICVSTTQGSCASSFVATPHLEGPTDLGGTIAGLAPSTTYQLSARAVDGAGNSAGGVVERSATTGAAGQGSLRLLHFDPRDCLMADYEVFGGVTDFAVAGQRVVLSGSSESVSYRASDFADRSTQPRGLYYLIVDLATDRLYTLTRDGVVRSYSTDMNTLEEIDPTTGIVLGSVPLLDRLGNPASFYFGPHVTDGLGQAIVYGGNAVSDAFEIDLATGVVTNLGPIGGLPGPARQMSERFEGESYVLYAADLYNVSRYGVSSGAVSVVTTMPPYVWADARPSLADGRMVWLGTAFGTPSGPSGLEAFGSCRMSFDRP